MKETIKELKIELVKLNEKIQAIRAIEKPTTDNVKEINALCDQVDEIYSRIKAEERAEETTKHLHSRTTEPANQGQPGDQRKFESFGHYLQAVARAGMDGGGMLAGQPTGRVDHRLLYQEIMETRSTGLEESTPSLGGFLIEKDYAAGIWKKAHDASILFQKVRKVPLSGPSNGLKIRTVDETSRVDGSREGGVLGYWQEEGSTKTASKPKFGLLELSLHKLIGLYYATDELLQDVTALETLVSQMFADEFSFKIDDSILNGTGSGQPLGILACPALISVTKETGQIASSILWDNLKKMYARLWPRGRPNMIWIANQDCLPELMSMSQPHGTGGQSVWLPANGAYGLSHDTLMGRPIFYPEQCQTCGTLGDIYLVDLSQYIMITKGGLQSASSIHVKFVQDEQTFRFVYRLDGQPLWNNKLTPYKGTNTVSPFIALALRA